MADNIGKAASRGRREASGMTMEYLELSDKLATPMASGTVALVKSAHPEYTVAQIESALFNAAKDLGKAGKDTSYGWGRVDAFAAVNYAA